MNTRRYTRDHSSKKTMSSIGGMAFVACMFFGLALGFATGNVPTFLFIGMGVGMIASAAIRLADHREKHLHESDIDMD